MIVLATPTRDNITAGTTGDIVRLCRLHPEVKFLAALGIYIANLRQYCVQMAKQVGASHILCIDSDMRFPEDTLDRLLEHDLEIVAANCVQRTAAQWWTSRIDGQSVTSLGRTGLQEVDSIGLGVALIKLSVFDALARPWFPTPYDGENHIGEDISFCRKARAAGFKVWIDHDLSQSVQHQGAVELGVHSFQVTAVA